MMVKMQGFASHFFAAMMTFTVLTFPTPGDLTRIVGEVLNPPEDENLTRFPMLMVDNRPIKVALGSEEFYPIFAACRFGDPEKHHGTGEPCRIALDQLAEDSGNPSSDIRISRDKEALKVAATFYCRAVWTQEFSEGRTFDIDQCVDSNQVVAPSLN